MTTERNQSAIREVRDQLGLDFADGERLNVVSGNLGLDRPVFGFSDDSWRALAKAIALQFKQVRNRFRAVMAILFGPQITEVGTLAEDVAVGDRTIVVNDASSFPQIGTLVLDEGLVTEETLEYCFIDYASNTIFLVETTGTTFAHTAVPEDAEQPLIAASGTTLILPSTRAFATTGLPYVAVVGRGTANEEEVEVTAVDQVRGTLTLSGALVNTHAVLVPSVVQTALSLPYAAGSTFIVLDDTDAFPDEGFLLAEAHTDSVVATAGTVSDVTVAGGTFISDIHNGFFVKFRGNVTAALTGVERGIADNTDSVITFTGPLGVAPVAGDEFIIIQAPFNATAGTATTVTVNAGTFTVGRQVGNVVVFDGNVTAALENVEAIVLENTDDTLTFTAALPATPVAGDTFRIRPLVEYTSNDNDNNALNLVLPIFDFLIPEGTRVELLESNSTAAAGQVQVKGCLWDLFEVTPRQLDIFIPEKLRDVGDLRSASYLHTEYIDPTPSTTLASPALAADTFVDVVSDADFPLVGVIVLDPGGTAERVGYYKDSAVANRLQIPNQGLANGFGGGTTVELYQPRYGTTSILVGDPFNTADTFPGPYLYETGQEAPTGTVALTTLSDLLSGPTTIEMDQSPTLTALEVENAMAFDLVNFPYSVLVGRDTGNRETVVVNDVNLRSRVATTVSGAVLAGATEIPVAALSGGGAGDAADFPNANGYRVLIDNGEIVYVTGTATGPDRLLIQDGLVTPLAGGEELNLLADVLTVNALTDFHEGRIPRSKRSTAVAGAQAAFPTLSTLDITSSEIVEPLISSFDVVSSAGLDVTGGRVILNYGNGQLPQEDTLQIARSPGDTLLTVSDSDRFPTTFPFVLVVEPGHPLREERHLVTANNTGTEELTINGGTFGLLYTHAIGATVAWEPGPQEVLEYDSITGNTLSFSPAIMLQSTHSPAESVIDSSIDSVPRDDGFDYPFRMPPDIEERVRFLFDLIRAAGVQVTFIDAR